MRGMLGIVAAACWIGLLAAAPSLGAEGKQKQGKESGISRCRGGRMGLTDEQADKMKELKKSRKKAVAPLREKLKEEMQTLQEQVRDEDSDKDIQATLNKLQDLHKSIQAENEKFKKQLESLLTPSQQAKLLLVMGRRHARGGPGFGGRGPEMGPGRREGWGGGRGHGGGRGWGPDRGRGFGDEEEPPDRD